MFSLAVLLVVVSAEAATTITVTSTADAGGSCPGATCTLRQAIATAAAGDTINFSLPAQSTITLTSAELVITRNLTISGLGTNLLTVQRSTTAGTPAFRIFNIIGNPIVTISGLTIANGRTAAGGGIFLSAGVLTITNCTISGNSAADGGGIYNDSGTIVINYSTISGNSATNSNGSASGGGISNLIATVNINNSTIAGNTNSGNSATSKGGGISNGGTLNVKNTIIARNTAAGSPDVNGTLTSQGYNLIGNTSGTSITIGTTGTTTGNQLNVDPKLETDSSGNPLLKDNGGPTKTIALLSGSPAIEGGNSSGSTTDQRGFQRPVDDPTINNAPGGDGSDIGAYEVQGDQLPGCGNRVVINNNDSGAGSLRFAIANVCGGETITFASSVVSPIILTSGELLLNKGAIITGPGANLLSVQRSAASGTPNFRIFNIASSSVITTISGLTIANGNPGFVAGGGIINNGTLTLSNATISGNVPGGIFNNNGTLTISNSTISGNLVGGGITNSGMLTITNSTISGNTKTLGSPGGGINNSGTLTLTNSTISGNSAASGGGISDSGLSGTAVNARNTIIAGNTATSSSPDFSGALTSQGFNFIGNNSGAAITPAQFTDGTDQIGTAASPKDPLLGPLQNNGGPTQTLALFSGSTAINKGHSSGSTTDQRGFIRPVGSATVGGGDGSDIGAFELAGLASNVSTRLPVGTDDNVLIEGFIVQGPAGSTKKIIVRAIGPSLLPFGITDALANPTLVIKNENVVIATNDNWRTTQIGGIITADQSGEIATSGAPPTNDNESAIIANLAPGNYTATVAGFNRSVGTGVVDAFDLSAASPARLANVATRGLIQPNDKLMIAGFIIQNGPVRAVVLAIGPSLLAFGINNALQDTTLQVKTQNGTTVIENDDWESNQKAELEQTTLQPSHPKEAAVVVTLQPGQYTAQVRGKPETTGIGVVQVYFLQ